MPDPTGNIVIRRSIAADAAALRGLRLEALQRHPSAFLTDYESSARQPMSYWSERAGLAHDDPWQALFLAESGGELLAMTGIVRGTSPRNAHSATIWGVYVRPAWRGRRIAEQLIEACVAWARTHAVLIVKLTVNATNVAAIRCYTRCGFEAYGTEPLAIAYAGQFDDELLMARRIDVEAGS